METLQENVKYLFIDKKSNLYNQAIELRYKELFEGFNGSKESIFDETEDKGRVIVAYVNGIVIGQARLFMENSIGEISQVVIDNEYRGMKIGSGLMNALINEAVKNNVKLIGLDSHVHIINFYRSMGFKAMGDIFSSRKTGLSHIRMIKEI